MKALYCIAGSYFIKTIEADHRFSEGALMHLAKGEWIKVDLPSNFDGSLSHYKLDGSEMVYIPKADWPENQDEAEGL